MSTVVVENRLPLEATLPASLATLQESELRDLEDTQSDPTKSFPETLDEIALAPIVVPLPFAGGLPAAGDPLASARLNVSVQEPVAETPSRLQHMREAASYLSFFLAGYK